MSLRRFVSMALLAAVGTLGLVRAQEPTPAEALAKGIEQVRAGAFDDALLTLDRVVRALEGQPTAAADLKRAHVWLGTAYVGLEQEEAARRHYKEALRMDKALALDPAEFSPRAIRVFEATRKGKSKTALYAGGGIGIPALVGGAIALAGAGSVTVAGALPTPPPSATPAPTPTPTPSVLTFSGSIGTTRPFYRAFEFSQRNAGRTSASVSAAGGGVTFDLYLCNGVANSPENCNTAATVTGNDIAATMSAGTNTAIVFARVNEDTSFTLRVTTP